MSERTDELKLLRERLDFLQKIDTQEDFDEGARLHNAKNAPWVHGQYSDMKFEPYVYKPYPRMLYNGEYDVACVEYENALILPARGSEEGARQHAIAAALRKKQNATCTVQDESEHAARKTRGWFDSPTEAVEMMKAVEHERFIQQAHREFEDKGLSEPARREATAFDDAAGDFTPEIPQTPIRRKPGRKPKMQEATV